MVTELTSLMVRLMRAMRAPADRVPDELRARLESVGLARRHTATLIALAADEPVTVGRLAQRLALNPATTSQLVNELDRGGLVERREDPSDRRRTLVGLHPDSRALVEKLARRRLDDVGHVLEAMPPAAREHFMQGWRLLVDAMESVPETNEVPTA